jgi:sigma-E factor negative regulatory protein RseC
MAERQAAVAQTLTGPEGLILVRLEFAANGGCGRCHESGGCGGLSLAQPLCSKPKSIVVSDPIGLTVGDKVRVVIPDQWLAQGVTRTYVIPLLLFFAGSFLGSAVLPDLLPGQWQVSQDIGAMIGAGIGLIAGWVQLQFSQHHTPIAVPRIIERL